ncbi:WD40 repeat-like protein [Penicillium canescens]|uniref:WD40 repeat-like protein n=1 Tax=Penicillium canescens TaxID=5083 RepID=UPI0026DEB45F|nr:WD40 repeat-like protein [Penicillium canescens]KAJ6055861.1 WD40 repeat-like protein [Penicillium canescens]KAJ6074808.1 WD40 repeat-like protein [Penicillium canescens]
MLTRKCLYVYQSLRKNICRLLSNRTQRVEVDRQTIDSYLPPELHVMHRISYFLHDAKRFILKNRQIVDQALLQAYCVGLIFIPRTAILRKGAELQTLEGHSDSVLSVTFSPNGHVLSSSSSDRTDLATGIHTQTLEGYSGSVQSVVFSPNGRLLASGSKDRTVRLWDMATASGSVDWIVHLWDLATRALQQTIDGHITLSFGESTASESVAFSPDSQLLASCSANETVRLWDPAAGGLTQILDGDDSEAPVQIMSFSPDGRFRASGSYESPVTLNGHSRPLNSLTFSPDSRLLVSCSADKTAHLWNLVIGAVQQTINGHLDSINSVAFSPNGRLLASCSDDETVRLWDLATCALQQTLEGYSDPVNWGLNLDNGFRSAYSLSWSQVQIWRISCRATR